MTKVLVSWIGRNDLSSLQAGSTDSGPICSTLSAQSFDRVELLYSYPKNEITPYLDWLSAQFKVPIQAHYAELASPVHYGDIYQAAKALLNSLQSEKKSVDLNILLSPGTPAMQSIWVLLSKTKFPATFWESSKEQGVNQTIIPFDIAAEFVPTANNISSNSLSQLASASVPANAAFDDIITQNPP